jgi:hypothetical protein
MTSTYDLATSLLVNIPLHECDQRNAEYGEEEGCMICCVDDDNNAKSKDSKNGSIEEDTFFFTFALHVLLFVQFGLAFYRFPIGTTTGLRWSVVNYSIFLYVITTSIYRHAAKNCKSACSAFILLPEIFIDIMLLLVLFNKVVAAFLFLLVSMLCLAFLVVAYSIQVLIDTLRDESECDDDLQQFQDELDVGYFKGDSVRTMQIV